LNFLVSSRAAAHPSTSLKLPKVIGSLFTKRLLSARSNPRLMFFSVDLQASVFTILKLAKDCCVKHKLLYHVPAAGLRFFQCLAAGTKCGYVH